jgi:hypothetical protein
MSIKLLPSQERLHQLVDYDSETGILVWRPRDGGDRGFNGQFAGKRAGSPRGKGWQITIDRQNFAYHRIVWKWVYGTEPPPEIDHINGDTSDNRLVNLRGADRWLNAKNRGPTVGRVLPKGVRLQKGHRRYQAYIRRDGQTRSLGYFNTPEAAHVAYKIAAQEVFGEWARDTTPISAASRELIEPSRNELKRDPMAAEHRAKISASLTGRKTGPRSPEHTAKIVAAQRGKKRGPQTPEHIEKCRLIRIGKKKRPLTPEQRAAMSVRLLGKKRGPYTIREATVAAWARRQGSSTSGANS